MTDHKTKIILSAEDQTHGAFHSALGGMEKLQGGLEKIDGFASKIPLIGGAIAAAFGAASFGEFIKGSIEAADELDKLAQKTGATVEELAGLKYVATQTDGSIQNIADAAKKLSVNLEATPALFKDLGIQSKSTVGRLVELSDQFKTMPDGATKTALAIKLLGKSGADMIPFLNQGSAALREMIEQGQRMNPITTENARVAAEFKDNMAKLEFAAQGVGTELAKRLLPGLSEAAQKMGDAAVKGNLLKAALIGLGAAMKLPYDLLIPPENLRESFSLEGMKKELASVNELILKEANNNSRLGIEHKANLEIQKKGLEQQIALIQKKSEIEKAAKKESEKSSGDALDPTGLVNGYQELIKQMKDRQVLLDAENQNENRLTETEKFRVKILADMTNGTLKFTDAQKVEVRARLNQLLAVDKENESRKQSAILMAQQSATMRSLTGDFDLQAEASRRNMEIMSESQRALGIELDKIAKAEDRARESANKDFTANTAFGPSLDAKAKYADTMEKITIETDRQTEATKKRAAQQDAFNKTFEYGAGKALQSFADEAANTAASSHLVFTGALNGITDELTKFVTTSKLDFDSLFNSVISGLARIQIQKALVGLFGNFTTAWQFGTNIGSQQTSMLSAQSFAGGGYTGDSSRTGGLDGKGGFVAMLHPRETVVDHTKGQSAGITLQDNTVIHVDSRSDRAQVISDVSRLIDNKQAQLVDRLQRQGGLA